MTLGNHNYITQKVTQDTHSGYLFTATHIYTVIHIAQHHGSIVTISNAAYISLHAILHNTL